MNPISLCKQLPWSKSNRRNASTGCYSTDLIHSILDCSEVMGLSLLPTSKTILKSIKKDGDIRIGGFLGLIRFFTTFNCGLRERFSKLAQWLFLVLCFQATISIQAQGTHSVGLNIQARQFGFDMGIWAYGHLKKPELQPRFFNNKAKWGGLSLGVLRDPGEILVINDRLPGSKPFKLNKVSHTWMLQPQIGYLIVVSERKSRSELGFRLKSGISLPVAYSWPVHVLYYQPNFLSDGYIDVEYNPQAHLPNQIGGTSSWSNGFKDGQLIPGIGGQIAMEFEWGNYRFLTNSLSIGFNTSTFIKKIPNWHDVSMNRQVFPSVFATFALGFVSERNRKP